MIDTYQCIAANYGLWGLNPCIHMYFKCYSVADFLL